MNFLAKIFAVVFLLGTIVLDSHHCLAQRAKIDADTLNKAITIDTIATRRPSREDSIKNQPRNQQESDTAAAVIKRGPWQPDPKKAGLYSAILPGLGQAYNRQYWKIPIVYVGIGVATYFISDNLTKYVSYRKAYINRLNNPNYVDQYTTLYNGDQLKQLQDDYSKYLDLAVLFTGIGFGVQVVDAITSAHLKNFDISRDISMRIKPVADPYGAGIGIVLSLRNTRPPDATYQ